MIRILVGGIVVEISGVSVTGLEVQMPEGSTTVTGQGGSTGVPVDGGENREGDDGGLRGSEGTPFVCLDCGRFGNDRGECRHCEATDCIVPALVDGGEYKSPISHAMVFAKSLVPDGEFYSPDDFHTLLATALGLPRWRLVPRHVQKLVLGAALDGLGLSHDEYTNKETNDGSILLADAFWGRNAHADTPPAPVPQLSDIR